ncbi:MAG: amino acid-binding protein [Lachnospiraceae bacterium]
MLKQLSVYAENKKGNMQRITSILVKENVNIWGSVTNDSAEYGIIRMVVSDPDQAMTALIDAGFLCRLTEVIGVEMEDEVGNLNQLLGALSDSNINVDYTYLSFNRDSGKPVLIFHAEEIGEVEDCIVAKGFHVVSK